MGTLIQCQSFVSLSVSEMTSLRWEIQIFSFEYCFLLFLYFYIFFFTRTVVEKAFVSARFIWKMFVGFPIYNRIFGWLDTHWLLRFTFNLRSFVCTTPTNILNWSDKDSEMPRYSLWDDCALWTKLAGQGNIFWYRVPVLRKDSCRILNNLFLVM